MKLVIESPVLLVVIIPAFLLLFLFTKVLVSIPDAVNDLKNKDKILDKEQ
jgi:hypothetical protein